MLDREHAILGELHAAELYEALNRDGQVFAETAMQRAGRSHDIALAILGVAAGQIIDGIDAKRRRAVLRNFLESFEP